ncbi:MAG: hypothetical protein IKX14_04170 [Neisseriaceae bacterium]|nr:hypothetical protein [Neisseriaceae bacterium]
MPTVTAEYNITAEYIFNFALLALRCFRQPENMIKPRGQQVAHPTFVKTTTLSHKNADYQR